MMKQYNEIKKKYPDAVLFFRLGDFYEMFNQDAAEVSAILNLTLTRRHNIPMCGIPYHAAQAYVGRLLKAGKKIAVCEQTKMPEKGKGIAQREVVEVLTPGTIVDIDLLDQKENNYILCIAGNRDAWSMAAMDLSTGVFETAAYEHNLLCEQFRREQARLRPAELVIQESILEHHSDLSRIIGDDGSMVVNRYPDWYFYADQCRERLQKQFRTSSLKAFGFSGDEVEILACGGLIGYLEETSHRMLGHIRSLKRIRQTEYMGLDESTLRNLEILRNQNDGSVRYSLLGTIDKTRTAMGGRMLRRWLTQPLLDLEQIKERSDVVEAFFSDQELLEGIRVELGGVLDLERLTARIAMDKAHGKDLVAVRNTLRSQIRLEEGLRGCSGMKGLRISEPIQASVSAIAELIARSIDEEPSILLTEGRLIRRGYSEELDELTKLRDHSKQVLDEYLNEEKKASGIPNLRIKYNKIIGHFIEVTKSHLSLVPGHFIRRQSLVNAERFTTERLADLESRLNSARDRIIQMERELFLAIREEVKKQIPVLQETGRMLARIDVLSSLARAATLGNWVRPRWNEEGRLGIVGGRHPVVEENLPPGEFIPNDSRLDTNSIRFALITGPNMAGKSTYLRQTALIQLLAQTGSFLPASEADLCVVDKIFCRVGASDNLARGESTFLVEMNEAAFILRTATENSLVIMDEVGRGTSTNDGLSLAWAISEYILYRLRAKTLFATHYHELTEMQEESLVNLSMDVNDEGEEIVFLKKVVPKPASSSYGIHVARLAGLPREVIGRARDILVRLQRQEGALPAGLVVEVPREPQPNLFPEEELLLREVQSLDIDRTTPLEALNILNRLKRKVCELD